MSPRELCRVNVLEFATKRGLDDERVIAAFLQAARVGIFELSWNILCPGCGGVLDAAATLRNRRCHMTNFAFQQVDVFTSRPCSATRWPSLLAQMHC